MNFLLQLYYFSKNKDKTYWQYENNLIMYNWDLEMLDDCFLLLLLLLYVCLFVLWLRPLIESYEMTMISSVSL